MPICRWLNSIWLPLDSDSNALSVPFCLCWSYWLFHRLSSFCAWKAFITGSIFRHPCLFVFHPPIHAHIYFSTFLAEELSFCALFGFLNTPWFLFTPPYSHWPFLCFPGIVVAWWHSSPLSVESFIHHASFLSCCSSLNVTLIFSWFCSTAVWLSVIILISSLLFIECRNKISCF